MNRRSLLQIGLGAVVSLFSKSLPAIPVIEQLTPLPDPMRKPIVRTIEMVCSIEIECLKDGAFTIKHFLDNAMIFSQDWHVDKVGNFVPFGKPVELVEPMQFSPLPKNASHLATH